MQIIFYLAFFYLLLPFFIFVCTWLNWLVAFATALIFIGIFWRNYKNCLEKILAPNNSLGLQVLQEKEQEILEKIKLTHFSIRSCCIALIIITIWVLFSGIGGYCFQNFDHHWRNALLRDLIEYDWPIIYENPNKKIDPPQLEDFLHKNLDNKVKNILVHNKTDDFMLVYYVGYWMPSAMIGKYLGWQATQIFLFFWTVLGIFLAVIILSLRLRLPFFIITLFFIFFSGMDILGISYYTPSLLLSPIRHLEWWGLGFQYSSFTTQLFWVFNQAIPSWICLSLLVFGVSQRVVFLLWSLCFFYAPLPAAGLTILLVVQTLMPFQSKNRSKENFNILKNKITFAKNIILPKIKNIIALLTFENILGGGCIVIISLLFFSQNFSGKEWKILSWGIHKAIGLFFMLEVGILLLLLYFFQYKNKYWYMVFLILSIAPWIQIGHRVDFPMRASIPSLLLVMVWTIQSVLAQDKKIIKYIIITVLIFGMATPIYEINRSVIRTYQYYFEPAIPPLQDKNLDYLPETTHPNSLTADSIHTFSSLTFLDSEHFLGFANNKSWHKYFFRQNTKKCSKEQKK